MPAPYGNVYSLVEDGPKIRGLSCVLSGAKCIGRLHYSLRLSLLHTRSVAFELCLTLISQMGQARSAGVVFVFFCVNDVHHTRSATASCLAMIGAGAAKPEKIG
jgi:hypothetical protein